MNCTAHVKCSVNVEFIYFRHNTLNLARSPKETKGE